MQKARFIVVALVLSLLVSIAGNVVAQDGTIVDVAAGNADFSTLVSLVDAAGLVDTLNSEGPFTVFAPTNAAFEAVPQATLDYLAANPDLLIATLTYHVVGAQVMAADVATGDVETVQGGSIAVVADDMGVTVDGVPVTATDIVASNGVIHVIESVLIPTIELPAVDPLDYSDGSIFAAGSSTVFPLAERLGELWSEAGGIAPSIDSIGSGGGYERFCVAGESDISNGSRAIRDSEIESCEAIGRTPIEFRVGTDALAVTVSTENDFVTDVTAEELALIFSTAELWSDVRAEWPSEPIARFIPGTDSGTFDYFVEEIFEEDEAPALNASNLQQSEDDNVLVSGIQASPYAIGFFGFAYYQENQDTLNVLSIGGVSPNGTTAEDGTYPLARPLFMYSDAQILADKPEVAGFLNYVLTTVNDEIIEVGYFPASNRALNFARLQLLATGVFDM
ncbi:MAG: phosphate ABC transporter substrate-binding protein PstS family protein [Phototrophicaceae bacterium]